MSRISSGSVQTLVLLTLAFLTQAESVQAQNINVQFGSGSAGFTAFSGSAAAPGQGGVFNALGANPTGALLAGDTGGMTGASLTVTGLNASVFTAAVSARASGDGAQDVTALMQSGRRSSGACPFTVVFSGVAAGNYDVYLFGTGPEADEGCTFAVDGEVIPQTTDYTAHTGAIVAGLDYDLFQDVTVGSDGLMTIQGSTNGVTEYAALNGIQLHALSAAPEPSPAFIFGGGLLGLSALGWRTRTRARTV